MWKYVLPLCLVIGLAAPADAKKKRHKPAARAATTKPVDRADVPPKIDNASEFEKAKAELADLNSPNALVPTVTMDNQADDRENPIRKK